MSVEEKLQLNLDELQINSIEKNRIDTEPKLKKRLLEVEKIFDDEYKLQLQALDSYNAHKITISSILGKTSFSRPTIYSDELLLRFTIFLISRIKRESLTEKAKRAIEDKQNEEQFNQSLVSDVIELIHSQHEYEQMEDELNFLRGRVKELEEQIPNIPTIFSLTPDDATKRLMKANNAIKEIDNPTTSIEKE